MSSKTINKKYRIVLKSYGTHDEYGEITILTVDSEGYTDKFLANETYPTYTQAKHVYDRIKNYKSFMEFYEQKRTR